jgi:hypothetical protein
MQDIWTLDMFACDSESAAGPEAVGAAKLASDLPKSTKGTSLTLDSRNYTLAFAQAEDVLT